MLHTLITSADRAGSIASGLDPTFVPKAVVSIGDVGNPDPYWWGNVTVPKLRLCFDDITGPHSWYQAPSRRDALQIVAFLAAHPDVPMLIHCGMGVSRSSAVGYLRLAMMYLGTEEPIQARLDEQVREAADLGLRSDYAIHPNSLLVQYGLRAIARRERATLRT